MMLLLMELTLSMLPILKLLITMVHGKTLIDMVKEHLNIHLVLFMKVKLLII